VIPARTNLPGVTWKSGESVSLPQLGHFIPTGVTTMHFGQMGVPHVAQVRPVSTFGCLAQCMISLVFAVSSVTVAAPQRG